MSESKTTKAITTAQLAMSAIGLVKSIGLAVLVLMVDYFRRQQAKAEKELAVVETNLKIEHKKDIIEATNKAKGHAAVVNDWIKSDESKS